jgi:cysteinyl-tRNA synthetase
VRRLADLLTRLRTAAGGSAGLQEARSPAEATRLEQEFRSAMDDDLNAPKAVGAVFSFVRGANRELDAGRWGPDDAAAALATVDRVLGVLDLLPGAQEVDDAFRSWVEDRVAARTAARSARDFAAADAIRDELAARGVELEDTAQGTRWRRRGA